MNNKRKVSVLFVCMGNICRSPTAQGMFEQLVQSRKLDELIEVDSAGTHAYHIGEQPDSRSRTAALERGIDLSVQRARKATPRDFDAFDYVIAMDQANYSDLEVLASESAGMHAKLHLFMEFAERWETRDVPDPYYGGNHGFERVLDMVEDASQGLLEHILRNKTSELNT